MTRTIISALYPHRCGDSFTEIWLKVWFEELADPVIFLATPFDIERHGKELWIRAMSGEFGLIEILPDEFRRLRDQAWEAQRANSMPMIEAISRPKMLEYHGQP